MKIGYARISTGDQSMQMQTDALKGAGCEKVFTDRVSGAAESRPGLDAMLAFARPGDQIVVWKLDRLGRSVRHLIDLVTQLGERGIELQVLHGAIDTSTPAGKVAFHIFSSFAEFERDLIRERTQAGLAAARARGRSGGRPPAISPRKAQQLVTLVQAEPDRPVQAWCDEFEISRATYYRHIKPLLHSSQASETSGRGPRASG